MRIDHYCSRLGSFHQLWHFKRWERGTKQMPDAISVLAIYRQPLAESLSHALIQDTGYRRKAYEIINFKLTACCLDILLAARFSRAFC